MNGVKWELTIYRNSEIPEYWINLVYAKAVEIREEYTIKNFV